MKIIYQDQDLMVIDKPAEILVHPTSANEKQTLVSWFIDKFPDVTKLNWPDNTRPGIVHRLDKDTSGIIVLVKTPEVLAKMQEQFKSRKIKKTYITLTLGDIMPKKGKIEVAITRGGAGLQKVLDNVYSFSKEKIRPAVTEYKVIDNYQFDNQNQSLVEVIPKTGRTHQIRVHLKYIGHPIIGDPLYHTKASRKISNKLNLYRQFLHATKLEFIHPKTNKKIIFESKLSDDLQNVLDGLK